MISHEDKDRFIELIEEGNDRATAAFLVNPDYTGSMFKRLCNPQSSKYYDAEFAARYTRAVESRGPADRNRAIKIRSEERESRHINANGFVKANHLTQEQLEQFCELVSTGVQAATAARQVEPPTSITQINRRAERDSVFQEAYHKAKTEGYPAYQEELRAEAARQAFAGDYRALQDQMKMHLPEAQKLMTQRHEVGGVDGDAIRLLAEKHFPGMPSEKLSELIEYVEEQERKQLPPGEQAA